MVCIRTYGKIYRKDDNKLVFYIVSDKQPITVKNRGRWWIYYGTWGLMKCHFNFEFCDEYVIIDADREDKPHGLMGGVWFNYIKTLEDLLK